MNKILIFLLLLSFVIIFFAGLFVGVYKFFPYSELNNIKNQFETKTVKINDSPLDPPILDELISIQSINELEEKRNQLIQFVWKTNNLPKELPDIIDTDISDERFSTLTNLKQINNLDN